MLGSKVGRCARGGVRFDVAMAVTVCRRRRLTPPGRGRRGPADLRCPRSDLRSDRRHMGQRRDLRDRRQRLCAEAHRGLAGATRNPPRSTRSARFSDAVEDLVSAGPLIDRPGQTRMTAHAGVDGRCPLRPCWSTLGWQVPDVGPTRPMSGAGGAAGGPVPRVVTSGRPSGGATP
jgi:hypothetical protein